MRFPTPQKLRSGKAAAKLRHKLLDGGAPFLRLMHRVVDEYVGRREFVYDSWVPRISPKFLEPSGYDILVILHRIASVHPLSVSREAPPAATRMFVITLRTYPISELAGGSPAGGVF